MRCSVALRLISETAGKQRDGKHFKLWQKKSDSFYIEWMTDSVRKVAGTAVNVGRSREML